MLKSEYFQESYTLLGNSPKSQIVSICLNVIVTASQSVTPNNNDHQSIESQFFYRNAPLGVVRCMVSKTRWALILIGARPWPGEEER